VLRNADRGGSGEGSIPVMRASRDSVPTMRASTAEVGRTAGAAQAQMWSGGSASR